MKLKTHYFLFFFVILFSLMSCEKEEKKKDGPDILDENILGVWHSEKIVIYEINDDNDTLSVSNINDTEMKVSLELNRKGDFIETVDNINAENEKYTSYFEFENLHLLKIYANKLKEEFQIWYVDIHALGPESLKITMWPRRTEHTAFIQKIYYYELKK